MAQSTFPRTMLEMTLIRMASLRPVLPIEDILRKLNALDKEGDVAEESVGQEKNPVVRSSSQRKRRGRQESFKTLSKLLL